MDVLKYFLIGIPSILFIAIGISIKYFKAYWLISGYNTMSRERRQKVDVKKLGGMMGSFCFALAGFLYFILLSAIMNLFYISIILGVLLVATIIFLLIRSQKFDREAVNERGKMKTGTKIGVTVVVTFLLMVFSGVGVLLYQSNLPIKYTISSDSIQISGMYGETINDSDIVTVSLREVLPEITLRTNGSAIGSKLKGYFNVTGLGNAKLFLDTETPPFIFIETKARMVILNDTDRTKTTELYNQIKSLKTQ